MSRSKLLPVAILVDGVLLLILCLVLGIYIATPESISSPLVVELATDEPMASATFRPTQVPSITLTPTQTATSTPFPTMARVTPLPTLGIEEPTKQPYVFPSPILIPPGVPPTPTRTGAR